MAKSRHKRSITIARHRTSISLEDAFWEALSELAEADGRSVAELVSEIDQRRGGTNRPRTRTPGSDVDAQRDKSFRSDPSLRVRANAGSQGLAAAENADAFLPVVRRARRAARCPSSWSRRNRRGGLAVYGCGWGRLRISRRGVRRRCLVGTCGSLTPRQPLWLLAARWGSAGRATVCFQVGGARGRRGRRLWRAGGGLLGGGFLGGELVCSGFLRGGLLRGELLCSSLLGHALLRSGLFRSGLLRGELICSSLLGRALLSNGLLRGELLCSSLLSSSLLSSGCGSLFGRAFLGGSLLRRELIRSSLFGRAFLGGSLLRRELVRSSLFGGSLILRRLLRCTLLVGCLFCSYALRFGSSFGCTLLHSSLFSGELLFGLCLFR